jgi:hypothetical protein
VRWECCGGWMCTFICMWVLAYQTGASFLCGESGRKTLDVHGRSEQVCGCDSLHGWLYAESAIGVPQAIGRPSMIRCSCRRTIVLVLQGLRVQLHLSESVRYILTRWPDPLYLFLYAVALFCYIRHWTAIDRLALGSHEVVRSGFLTPHRRTEARSKSHHSRWSGFRAAPPEAGPRSHNPGIQNLNANAI